MASAKSWFSYSISQSLLQIGSKCRIKAAFSPKNYLSTITHSHSKDTIYAISTGNVKAGVAIIRVSGPKAKEAIQSLTSSSSIPSPKMAVQRKFIDPSSGNLIDQGLLLWFKGPKSFTGEDVVEFHVHGGNAVKKAMLVALSSLSHFRLADPGEFTKRAFENNKLDLTEVEGLADLLQAETEAQRRQALRQYQGSLKTLYEDWKQQLTNSRALIEAYIDFGEDENIESDILEIVQKQIQKTKKALEHHLNDGGRGEMLKEGIHIAIVGPPNAGKSTLFNLLAKRDAAIVSSQPGTTRDIVEVQFDLGGFPVVLCDTAGIRETSDAIEIEGIRRAKERAKLSDIQVYILDIEEALKSGSFAKAENIIDEMCGPHSIVILNKIDKLENQNDFMAFLELWKNRPMLISCVNNSGVEEMLKRLEQLIASRFGNDAGETPYITQTRYRNYLNQCLISLQYSLEQLTVPDTMDPVIIAEELRVATRWLGKITGHVEIEEVLDVIFKEFCIGK